MNQLKDLDALGRYEGIFLRCKFEGEKVVGSFYLEQQDKKTNIPKREFKLVDL